ncbi:hypothetical protein [Leucobacter tenebrionis]|uniref:hypothetical protein n=1 Tax=Leucobacter tenebrionis TaxID=2873270 RepID=UPI001CA61859|nr:hypothetical protein [Leucobacter tenebrionis]QZY51202.1 hypothetical protein KVY00_11410 [Leucobacter tenebrionis]
MKITTIARVGGALAAAALTVSLAACSGGQRVADACSSASEAMQEVNANTNSIMQEAMAGDADYAELFKPVQEALSDAEKKVTNEEVLTPLSKVSSEFDGLVEQLSGLEIPNMDEIDPTDPAAMEDIEKMQADLEEASASMQERADALTKASQDLAEVCNVG